jgi:hypothetical protein
MIDTKDTDKEHATCPFSKLKSSKLKSSKLKSSKLKSSKLKSSKLKSSKTPCPFTNILIKDGHLDAKKKWSVKNMQDALKKQKMSNVASFIFAKIIENVCKSKKLSSVSAKNISKPGVIEHPGSISRDDFGKGDYINFSDKQFNLIYKYFPNKKYITFTELTEYRHFLYKKSLKESPNLNFGPGKIFTTGGETCLLFISLSKNDKLSLKKMRDVFKQETLHDVEIKSINVSNLLSYYVQFYFHWFNASLKQ